MIQTETERKFLVRNDDYKKEAVRSYRIRQGYIAQESGNTVRVRIMDAEAFLTIKGPSADRISRTEWEMEIPVDEAEILLVLCGGRIIDKIRHIVPEKGGTHTFEVDEFQGFNAGLTVAEIEFPEGLSNGEGSADNADEPFHSPAWLGAEVTSDRRYTNAALSRHPFSTWEQD